MFLSIPLRYWIGNQNRVYSGTFQNTYDEKFCENIVGTCSPFEGGGLIFYDKFQKGAGGLNNS